MATGDRNDQVSRLKSLLPPTWFGDSFPILSAVLQGIGNAGAFAYSLLAYVRLQTRIRTALDGFLDMIAADFFGAAVTRGTSADVPFRARIIAALFRERATRRSIVEVVTDLTGRAPVIFEPGRVQDTGAYGYACGYGVGGAWGSLLLPYQGFIDVFKPVGTGIPLVAGYGISTGGYSQASRAEWAKLGDIIDTVSDQDIYDAINAVKVEGTIAWTRIHP